MKNFKYLTLLFALCTSVILSAQITQTRCYSGATPVSLDNSSTSLAIDAFAFPAGYIVSDVNIVIAFDKTDGTCGAPDAGCSFHNETIFRLDGPNGSSIVLAPSSSWSGCDNISPGVTATFNDGAFPTPSGTPATTTYSASAGSINSAFCGEDPNDSWSLFAEDDIGADPLCVQSVCVTVTADFTVTGWQCSYGACNDNGTPCDVNDDYRPCTGTVTHSASASCAGDGQFVFVYDAGGLNLVQGPFSYTPNSTTTNFTANIPTGLPGGDWDLIDADLGIDLDGSLDASGPHCSDDDAPTAVCMDVTVDLDGSGSATISEDAVDDGSSDATPPLTFDTDITSFDCADVDNSPIAVVLTVTDACGLSSTCGADVYVENDAPIAVCMDITVNLDANGMTSIAEDAVDDGSSDVGSLSYDTDITDFDCQDAYDYLTDGTPVVVTLTVTDVCGAEDDCTANVTVLYSGNDEDCDGVGDECDQCPNGDDSVDYNGDGDPDCSNYPGFGNIDPSWKCGNNNKKILICHRPPDNTGNYNTLCISAKGGALADHISHGDPVGPCIGCEVEVAQGQPFTGNADFSSDEFEVYPNPTSGDVNVNIGSFEEGPAEVTLYDTFGRVIDVRSLDNVKLHSIVAFDLSHSISGVYVVTVQHGDETYVKRVVLQR